MKPSERARLGALSEGVQGVKPLGGVWGGAPYTFNACLFFMTLFGGFRGGSTDIGGGSLGHLAEDFGGLVA